MTTEDKSQMPLLSHEDEKEAQKVSDHPSTNGTPKVNHKRTGFEDKTLWDKLNLFGTLAIPIVVALATIAFGFIQFNLADQQHLSDQKLAQQQHDNDQKIANQQHEADQKQALDQQQAAILQTYIDNIQDLLLNHNLLKSRPGDDVAILARARTLTALQGLDLGRKSRLLIFLHEAQLIGFIGDQADNYKLHNKIIDLSGADLSGVDLSGVDLSGVDLIGADLRGAHLDSAGLSHAILGSTDLRGADLSGTVLLGADLSNAHLESANLTDTNLSSAYLAGAYLDSADLAGAVLYKADLDLAHLSSTDLTRALYLTQQQLDQVYSCKNATLPPGLKCHHNQ